MDDLVVALETLTPALARRRTAQREREYSGPLSPWERDRVRGIIDYLSNSDH